MYISTETPESESRQQQQQHRVRTNRTKVIITLITIIIIMKKKKYKFIYIFFAAALECEIVYAVSRLLRIKIMHRRRECIARASASIRYKQKQQKLSNFQLYASVCWCVRRAFAYVCGCVFVCAHTNEQYDSISQPTHAQKCSYSSMSWIQQQDSTRF